MEKLHPHRILFPLFLLLPLQFSSRLLLSSAYVLPDKYFINCGSDSDNNLRENRVFVGDKKARAFSISVGRSDFVKDKNPSSDTSPLYHTARVYGHPFFYGLEIKPTGTYLVRLHFFAFASPSNLAHAIFNVSASNYPVKNVSAFGFSLLSNFSLRNSTNLLVIKEFFLTINEGIFRLDFTPQESSLAFVNAIEVFIAPESFIPNNATHVTLAGGNGNYSGLHSEALHTVQRINVGGLTLTPENDSLWRTWIPDDDIILNPEAASNVEDYSNKPYPTQATEFIAPAFVYMSAEALNTKSIFFNITWHLKVTKNATHLVRAHFCDIVSSPWIYSFDLYIYSKFGWRIIPFEIIPQLAAPFYLDFVVDSDDSGFMDISVGPPPDSPDQIAFLNGLEIMELMKKSGPVPMQREPKNERWPIIFGSVGGLVLICIMLVGFLILKRRTVRPDRTMDVPLYGGSFYNRLTERNANVSLAPNLKLELKISFLEIQQATKNFNEKLLIGEGGFGKVYEGTFRGVKVAVKRSEPGRGQGVLQFQTEIMVLSQIRHRHLVSLIGYCDERCEMILVYEFMERGTLREHLYTRNEDSQRTSSLSELSWDKRLEICIGAAEGLHYLHTGLKEEIIHRDVKSTNILLDEHYVAKVADFGLSKAGPPDPDNFSMDLKGSFGYLDPESLRNIQFTEKSDVYSFGVVLLEVLCARPAIITSVQAEEMSLAEWGMSWQKRGQLEKIIDPFLVGKINPNSFRKFSEIAERCLKQRGVERPTMHELVYDLKYALQLQLTTMPREPHEDSTTNASWELPLPVVQRLPSNSFVFDEDDMPMEGGDDSETTASEMFSQSRIGDA